MAEPYHRSPRAGALTLAEERLRTHLRKVRHLAVQGSIPAARMALDDAMSDLDDIQACRDALDRDDD